MCSTLARGYICIIRKCVSDNSIGARYKRYICHTVGHKIQLQYPKWSQDKSYSYKNQRQCYFRPFNSWQMSFSPSMVDRRVFKREQFAAFDISCSFWFQIILNYGNEGGQLIGFNQIVFVLTYADTLSWHWKTHLRCGQKIPLKQAQNITRIMLSECWN